MEATLKTPDFSQPLGMDFVVDLTPKNGERFGPLFVEALFWKNRKKHLRTTNNLSQARRFTKATAEEVAKKVEGFDYTGRIEYVTHDNIIPRYYHPEKNRDSRYTLVEVIAGWIIVNPRHPFLAWSGSDWRSHDRGIPLHDNAQILNFKTREGAQKYANDYFCRRPLRQLLTGREE